MADLIIRGMEMPKNGYECPMNSFGVCHVATDGENCECYDVRPDWCPLVPLPEGHGRLIDADALASKMEKQVTERDKIMELCKRVGDTENYFRCSNNQTEIVSFVRMLNNAPTIVPAEGGGEDG